MILPCISYHIKKEGTILWILVQSDTVNDLILFIGDCDIFHGPVIFAFYLCSYLIERLHI